MTDFAAILARHERIAFQCSGGRDSLAALYLLRPHWDRFTVYWLNTGDAFPETVEVMAGVRAAVPHFVEVAGNQPQVVATFGLPSDLVPASRTPLGIFGQEHDAPRIQDRYSCCAHTIMLPVHQRMVEDGVTLIIRGQKNADVLKSRVRSGDQIDGFEMLFPIEDWSAEQVMDYLHAERIQAPRFYTMLDGAPDCMTCSAWWEHGAAKYLKQYHPVAHIEVQRRLDIINAAVIGHIAAFNNEVNS